jgi:hypothetical protein
MDENIKTIIESEHRPILVLVTTNQNCNLMTEGEQRLDSVIKLHKDRIRVLRLCFDETNMMWPIPLSDIMYYFIPNNIQYVFFKHTYDNIIGTFEHDIEVLYRMMGGMSLDRARLHDSAVEVYESTEEMFQEEQDLEHIYPPTTKMLRGFAKDMWNSAKRAGTGLPVLVGEKIATGRYDICKACPNLTDEARCTECGCFMKKKVNLSASSCPIGKWDSVE